MRKHIISLVVSVVIICGIAFNYDYFEKLLMQISDAAMELVDDGTGAAVEELESELDDLKAEKFFIIEETESTQEETESGSNFNTAKSYGIDIDNLNFSNSVQNHTGRPYQELKLLINEIIESKPPVSDPRGTNALSWTVEGTFNGSIGYYELIIDPVSNTVWHFVFKSQ